MGKLTRHAMERMQQRGISKDMLECLLEWGVKTHDHRGATIVYFNKAAKRRLAQRVEACRYRRLESTLGAYAVLTRGGEIVTVGHRTKRINRH